MLSPTMIFLSINLKCESLSQDTTHTVTSYLSHSRNCVAYLKTERSQLRPKATLCRKICWILKSAVAIIHCRKVTFFLSWKLLAIHQKCNRTEQKEQQLSTVTWPALTLTQTHPISKNDYQFFWLSDIECKIQNNGMLMSEILNIKSSSKYKSKSRKQINIPRIMKPSIKKYKILPFKSVKLEMHQHVFFLFISTISSCSNTLTNTLIKRHYRFWLSG